MSLFKLSDTGPLEYANGDKFKSAVSNAPIAVPILGTEKKINITEDFKWTKTLKDGRKNIPQIRLVEKYITRSSFIGNLQYAANVFVDSTQITTKLIAEYGGEIPVIGEFIKEGAETFSGAVNAGKKSFLGPGPAPKHLESYGNLYGTKNSGFIYFLPYLEDDWKQTTTKWSGGIGDKMVESMFTITKMFVEGFSMEAAKSYQFEDKGPVIKTTLFLDNTMDITDMTSKEPSWLKNWQLVFLLVYQNLPNRLNRFLVQPPVLYELRMSGMHYMPYCYLSSLQVKSHGVRKEKPVTLYLNGEIKEYTTLIPEVYEVNFAFNSLISESKNLLYEGLNNNGVNTLIENES